MSTEKEAQQAQTIARIEMEIKLSRATMISHGEARAKKNVVALLEIVDSQAQKIADLNRVGSNTLMALIESQEKIAEQAKRIAELEKDAAEHVCCLANNGW